MKKTLALLLLPIILFCMGNGAQAQDLSQKVPFNKDVKTGVLPNGLKYFIRKNNKPEGKIELRLVVNAGAIQEDNDQLGLAHFMEHMNFNGLKNFPKNEIVSYLQSIGVEFGADLNAYTSFDETVYILPIPTDDKDKIEKGFTILADWSGNALLEGDEIEAERGVVLEESRLRKGANDRMMQKWLPKYLNGSRYADRLPIGKDQILKNFKHDVIKRYYKDWYRPDLQAVMVVGNIEPNEAERLIKKYFSGFKNPANPRTRPASYDVPQRTEKDAMVLTDDENMYTIVRINGNSRPSLKSETAGDYKSSLTRQLFSTMLSARYGEIVNSANPPFFFGSTNIGGGWARGYENYSSFAVCGNDKIEEATKTMLREAFRVRQFGFTEAELTRARSEILSNYELLYNERDKTASGQIVSELVRHFLEAESVPGIEWEYEFAKAQLPQIELGDVNQVAKDIDLDKNYFALITAKPSDKLPTEKTLMQWVDEAANEKLEQYEETAIADHLLPKEPTPGKIVKTETDKELGTTTWTLGNGAMVTLKPTDFKNDEIRFAAERKGGYSLYKGKDIYSGFYCNNVVDEMGYGEFNQNDLNKFLTGKKASAYVAAGLYTESMGGGSTNKDVQTMFELLNLKCNYARMDEEGYKSYISKEKQQAEAMKSNPRVAFSAEMEKYMYNNNPYANNYPDPEFFDEIDPKNALAFYNERFKSVNGMHFVFVGSFDEEEMKPLVLKYIASMGGEKLNTNYKDVGMEKRKGVNDFVFKKGSEEQAMIMDRIYGDTKYDADVNSKLNILSEVINNKITVKLREEMGGIYGGGMRVSMNQYPVETYEVVSYLPCGPEKLEELRAAYEQILKDVQKPNGITAEDLNKAVAPSLQQYSEKLKDNGYWLSVLSNSYLYGNDPHRILDYSERVKAIKPEELTKLASKYLNAPNKLNAKWIPEQAKP